MRISIFLVFSFSVNAQNLNQIDNNGQKQGLWKKSYENGNLRYKGQFNNDIPIGIFYYYYKSGELQLEKEKLKTLIKLPKQWAMMIGKK